VRRQTARKKRSCIRTRQTTDMSDDLVRVGLAENAALVQRRLELLAKPRVPATESPDSQYLTSDLPAARIAVAFSSTSPVIDTFSTRSRLPGLTSRAKRLRARWGFGSSWGLYEVESHVDDVKEVGFE